KSRNGSWTWPGSRAGDARPPPSAPAAHCVVDVGRSPRARLCRHSGIPAQPSAGPPTGDNAAMSIPPLLQAWRDQSVSAIAAGLVTVLVGFASSVAIVFQAAQAMGATPAQTA